MTKKMAIIKNYQQFIEDIADRNFRPYVKRFQELAGLRPTGLDAPKTYLIEVTFDFGETLLEHNSIKNFKSSQNQTDLLNVCNSKILLYFLQTEFVVSFLLPFRIDHYKCVIH
jgi:hypothetical protein